MRNRTRQQRSRAQGYRQARYAAAAGVRKQKIFLGIEINIEINNESVIRYLFRKATASLINNHSWNDLGTRLIVPRLTVRRNYYDAGRIASIASCVDWP